MIVIWGYHYFGECHVEVWCLSSWYPIHVCYEDVSKLGYPRKWPSGKKSMNFRPGSGSDERETRSQSGLWEMRRPRKWRCSLSEVVRLVTCCPFVIYICTACMQVVHALKETLLEEPSKTRWHKQKPSFAVFGVCFFLCLPFSCYQIQPSTQNGHSSKSYSKANNQWVGLRLWKPEFTKYMK